MSEGQVAYGQGSGVSDPFEEAMAELDARRRARTEKAVEDGGEDWDPFEEAMAELDERRRAREQSTEQHSEQSTEQQPEQPEQNTEQNTEQEPVFTEQTEHTEDAEHAGQSAWDEHMDELMSLSSEDEDEEMDAFEADMARLDEKSRGLLEREESLGALSTDELLDVAERSVSEAAVSEGLDLFEAGEQDEVCGLIDASQAMSRLRERLSEGAVSEQLSLPEARVEAHRAGERLASRVSGSQGRVSFEVLGFSARLRDGRLVVELDLDDER